MLFNSYVFLFAFLPLVLVGWWLVFRRDTSRLAFLTLASYVFYAYHEFPRGLELLPLLLVSTNVDYFAGRAIHAHDDQRVRKRWLVAALAVNLLLLGVFKYLGFFEDSLDALLGLLGQPSDIPVHRLILPIGISFYTFNSMSYTIDIYRRNVEPAKSYLHYAAFVALFPHLVAGPIIRYSDLEVQLRSLVRRLTPRLAGAGLFFLVCGLFKKLVFADNVAPTVDRLFAAHDDLTVLGAWIGSFGYSLQLYFDFSGYSDMAVGLALLLGFQFPQNFDSPYKARNISEFARRWHMTLARWMRDYLFVTLGGTRGRGARAAFNVLLVVTLVGLWHGAAGHFALWGFVMGVWVIAYHQWKSRGLWMPSGWLAIAGTYTAVVLGLVLFRSPDLGVAVDVYAAMFGANGWGEVVVGTARGAEVTDLALFGVLGLIAFVQLAPNTWDVRLRPTWWTGLVVGATLAVGILLLARPSPFLYFQF